MRPKVPRDTEIGSGLGWFLSSCLCRSFSSSSGETASGKSPSSFALSVHIHGLTFAQWAICFAIGLISLLWSILIRLIPEKAVAAVLPETGNKEKDLLETKASLAMMSRGRYSQNRISSRMLFSSPRLSRRATRVD